MKITISTLYNIVATYKIVADQNVHFGRGRRTLFYDFVLPQTNRPFSAFFLPLYQFFPLHTFFFYLRKIPNNFIL